MNGGSTNDAGGHDGDRTPLVVLLRSLTVGQAWGIAVAIVALIGGSAGIGALVQSVHDEEKVAQKDRTISELTDQKNSTVAELKDRERQALDRERQATANVEGVTSVLANMQARERALKGKAEFLERFLTYRLQPSDLSKKLFVDHVCALWRQSQELSIHVEFGRLDVTPFDLRRGLTPEVRKFLEANGVSGSLLDQAAGPEPARVFPQAPQVTRTPANAIEQLEGQVQGVMLKKGVTFFDGATYRVPDEIAVAVHGNSNCAPH